MTDATHQNDDRHNAFMALVADTLGPEYNEADVRSVDAEQAFLFQEQASLYEQYTSDVINGREYATKVNALSGIVFRKCAKILGEHDFEILFGSSVHDEPWLIDVEAFLAHEELCRRALSAAHEQSNDLLFTSDMTQEQMKTKFDALVQRARSQAS